MSNSLRFDNHVKRYLLNEAGEMVRDEQCNVIIPFLPMGYEDYSNYGYSNQQYEIDRFLTYKRLGTGNDAFNIVGKGSTYIEPKLDEKQQIKIKGELGEYIFGGNESVSSTTSIENDTAFSEYKKQVASNTITFRIAPHYKLDENYKYLFYKVPEISKDILYRVESLEAQYLGRNLECYILTLVSIQQELENTGRAKVQNIMPNAPGQGYGEPQIIPHDEKLIESDYFKRIDDTRGITIDKSKIISNPVKSVVVKLFGLGILMSFTMVGRKVKTNDPIDVYGIPRLIFPMNLKQASTPTLFRAQQPENNFYFLTGLKPTIEFTNDLYNASKEFMEVNKTGPQQGICYYEPNAFAKSNPKSGDLYTYSLYGSVLNGDNGLKYSPGKFNLGDTNKNFDKTGVVGVAPIYTIHQDANNPRSIHDYLGDSYGVQKDISRIPLTKSNTLTFGSLIGDGLSALKTLSPLQMISGSILFGVGLISSLATQIPQRGYGELMGIIPASMFDFIKEEASISLKGNNGFKLSYLFNNEDKDFLTFFNSETLNTAFQAELTDLFIKDGVEYETTLIGQNKKEDGTYILPTQGSIKVNGSETLKAIEDTNTGFIIDSFNLQAIFAGEFSVEFLDYEERVIGSGVFQSSGKGANTIRECNTGRNTSFYGRENMYLETPKPGPEYVDPDLWGGFVPIVDMNLETPITVGTITTNTTKVRDLQTFQNTTYFHDFVNGENPNPQNTFTGNNSTLSSKGDVYFEGSIDEPITTRQKLFSTNVKLTPQQFLDAYKPIIKLTGDFNGNKYEGIGNLVVEGEFIKFDYTIVGNTLNYMGLDRDTIGLLPFSGVYNWEKYGRDAMVNPSWGLPLCILPMKQHGESGQGGGTFRENYGETYYGENNTAFPIITTTTLFGNGKITFQVDGVYLELNTTRRVVKNQFDGGRYFEGIKNYPRIVKANYGVVEDNFKGMKELIVGSSRPALKSFVYDERFPGDKAKKFMMVSLPPFNEMVKIEKVKLEKSK